MLNSCAPGVAVVNIDNGFGAAQMAFAILERIRAQSQKDARQMKLAYFDCPAGISGDMLLGALVDCGVSIEQIKEGLALLPINEF